MKFIIQHNLMNGLQLQLTKDAVAHYPHEFVGVIPFSHEITSLEPLVGREFIPYGSTLLTTLASDLKWKGLHFNMETFNYHAAVTNRTDMLNGEYLMEVEEAIRFFESGPRDDQEWFIRPSHDLKQFSGQVITAKDAAEWLSDALACDSSGSYQLPSDTPIVIAQPKPIQAEWRWFVVGGELISGSMYRHGTQLRKIRETSPDVIKEAQSFVNKWLPDPCCVMDLALVNDELYVIEFNCINSSGFYDNDVPAIFDALYKYHTRT